MRIIAGRMHMTLGEEKPEEESHFDRRRKYNELMAGGMSDKEAKEKVWPTKRATTLQNAKEKAEKEAGEAKGKA